MGTLIGLPGAKVAPWEKFLLKSREGNVKKLAANVTLIMTRAPEWEGAIAWDAFAERIIIERVCPAGEPGPWTDLADVQAAVWLQRSRWKLDASPELVASSIRAVAAVKTIHPLRDRLSGLKWDGVARLDSWTVRYLGAKDTEVHRELGKRWLLGAVARAFEPGSKMDTALILEGPQGRGKSTALRILSLGFFTDQLSDVSQKDASQELHGAWIIELAELDAIGKAEASRVKAFLTRQTDRYRSPYGRHVAEHPRQCVFAGSVNHNDYLRDETGGRRFAPIECGAIDLAALRADVESLWAETVARYQTGELTYTANSELSALIADHTSERYQGDVWTDAIETYAKLMKKVSVADCLSHVGVDRARWSQQDANRVAKILKSIGFRRRLVRDGAKRQWRYEVPVEGESNAEVVTTGQAEKQGSITSVTSVTSHAYKGNVNTKYPLIENRCDSGSTGTSGDEDDFDSFLRDHGIGEDGDGSS